MNCLYISNIKYKYYSLTNNSSFQENSILYNLKKNIRAYSKTWRRPTEKEIFKIKTDYKYYKLMKTLNKI